MGDLSASDYSWKKMVISKSNNKWFTTSKSESADCLSANMNTTNLSFDQDSYAFVIKEEKIDCVDSSDEDSDSTAPMEIVDPLLTPSHKKRRTSVGPKNETPGERAARLAKMSAYAAKRLANETPEQRAQRLRRMSEYAAKRLAQETSEQRARRLARMSAYAARRLASETPEQRQARLTRMSAYAARRQAMKKDMTAQSTDIHISTEYDLNHVNTNQS